MSAAIDHPHHVRVRPVGRWPGVGLAALWEYRELLWFVTKRELQIRYKQSVLGIAWALLQPLGLAFVFALFFGRLVGVPSEGVPYPVFALTGLTVWLFVSSSVAQSANSLVADANLLSKVYFPRLVLPLAKIGSYLVDLGISLVVLIVMTLVYGVDIGPEVLLIPAFVALAVVVALGAGIGLSALNVKYRDVQLVIPLVTQVWLFVSPVVYPGSLVEGAWRYVYALNPMVGVLDGARWALLGTQAPPAGVVAISCASAVVLLAAGVAYFRHTESSFADLV